MHATKPGNLSIAVYTAPTITVFYLHFSFVIALVTKLNKGNALFYIFKMPSWGQEAKPLYY